MTPSDNVLYFSNGYDVRLCTKNGMTTLRRAYLLCHFHHKFILDEVEKAARAVDAQFRMKYITKESSPPSYPFRSKSVRVAIKRDPVERFVSAIAYLNRTYKEDAEIVSDFILRVEQGGIKNVRDYVKTQHLNSQNYYMGRPEDYDLVYDIQDLPSLLGCFEDECNPPEYYDPGHISSIRKNVSEHKYHLTQEQEDRIRELYERDYVYGWY